MKLHDIFKKTKTIVKNFRDTVAEASREPEYPSVEPIREEGEKTQELVLRISGKSVAKATIIILSLLVLAYLITQIADILVVFFVAFLLAAAMEPAIDSLNKKKIPRGVAVIFFYIAAVAILGFIVAYILPILAQQISELAVNLGRYLKGLAQGQQTGLVPLRFQPYVQQFLKSINVHDLAGQIESALQLVAGQLFTIGGNLWEVIKIISHGFINTVLVLVLAYFMAVEKHSVDRFIFAFIPLKHEEYLAHKIMLVQRKIGFWVRGMLIMMLSMGALVFIGLVILRVNYATVLAIIAGILELVPVVGPLIAWLIAVPIVLNQGSFAILLAVTILYFVVQQIEGHVLIPIVMKKVVGLNPIVILFALLVGFEFLGILGAVLSVPVATMISIFVNDFFEKPKREVKH
jgi:predicted PurR-regulated permease PerM